MIYDQVELHNVAETLHVPGRSGVLLQRVPEAVRLQIREESQRMYRQAAGCEIRFVASGAPVRVTLCSNGGPIRAYSYLGDFAVAEHTIGTEPTTIELTLPMPGFLQNYVDLGATAFEPKVWRLVFQKGELHLLDITGEAIRPPRPEELPKLRYLAYGTSITQGESATHPDLTYVKQAAWLLRADAINLGAAGTAYCEAALADYFAERNDWDIASLCISVNMLNQGVSVDVFAEKASYMVRNMALKHPEKPIICMGILPSFLDLGLRWPDRTPVSTPSEYSEALRCIAESSELPNVHFIYGQDLLPGLIGHSHDLLHPSNHGMIEIGRNLADFMKKFVST